MTLTLKGTKAIDTVHILIVDDHTTVRQDLRTFLELQEGFEVVGEASNGLEAVEQASKLLPDLVLMDLKMPQMDGIEATRRIRAQIPRTQVIVLSGYNEKFAAAKEAGALVCLRKGLPPTDLIKAIVAAASGSAAPG